MLLIDNFVFMVSNTVPYLHILMTPGDVSFLVYYILNTDQINLHTVLKRLSIFDIISPTDELWWQVLYRQWLYM